MSMKTKHIIDGVQKMTLLWRPGYGTQESIIIKLNEYLLNPEHRDSKGQLTGKAAWFNDNLGFTRDNINDLAKQIKFDRLSAKLTVRTQYGQKYSQTIEIIGVNGKSKRVVFNWIENPDGIVRLIGTGKFPKHRR